jgi:glycosyltransferase 2 family protein
MTAVRASSSDHDIAPAQSFEAETPARARSVVAPAPASRRRGLLALQIVGTLVLVIWVLQQIDFAPLLTRLATMRWGVVGLLIGIGLLDRFVTAWKWHVLLVATNLRLSLVEAFRIQMIATFFGSFLPTAVGMDAVRIYLVSKATGRTIDSVSASTVDRLLTVLGTFVVAGAAMVVAALGQGGDTPYWLILLPMLFIATALLMTAGAHWTGSVRSISVRLFGDRVTAFAAKIYRSLHEFRRRPGAVAACCALTVGSFAVRVLFVQVAAVALRVDVALAALALSLPVTWVALMLPISIGGLGLQEGAYLVALSSVGVEPVSAVAIALLDQIVMRVVSLLGALFWFTKRFDQP